MISDRERLSPLYLPLGLGLIALVSGFALVFGRLVA